MQKKQWYVPHIVCITFIVIPFLTKKSERSRMGGGGGGGVQKVGPGFVYTRFYIMEHGICQFPSLVGGTN